MSAVTTPNPFIDEVHYPDCDGKPTSDNTLHFDWIAPLKWSAEAQDADDPNAFIASDHLISPVRVNNRLRQAPDTSIAFGRPKGHCGSDKVWAEAGVDPDAV